MTASNDSRGCGICGYTHRNPGLCPKRLSGDCCKPDAAPHVCRLYTGHCCYPNSEICPTHH